MKIRAIVTGASGMVGEGVLHECLLSDDVETVLVIGRRPCGTTHPKMKEVIHNNFYDLSALEQQLAGYNACFFCLGVSSIGMKEPEYLRLTYDLTLHAADTMLRINPGMTFCYVSGSGTDSSEKGKSMWARVKGKTENKLLQMPFKKAYMFRPAYIHPTQGLKNAPKLYVALSSLYPLWRILFPKYISTLKQIGQAMINAVKAGYEKSILEVADIVKLGNS